MKVTEQIDAMEVSGTNPFKFLVVSRVLATTLMIPVLTMYTGFVALLGGYLNLHQNALTSFARFFNAVFESTSFLCIFSTLNKSFAFGYTIGITPSYTRSHLPKD